MTNSVHVIVYIKTINESKDTVKRKGEEMFDVNLPSLLWFENGNVYTGSLMTDPKRGMMNCTTLMYRVQLVTNGKEKRFCAACRFRLPWNAKTNIEEYAVAYFEGTEKGKGIAESWISRQVFIPDIKTEEISTARRTFERMLIGAPGNLIETEHEEFLEEKETENTEEKENAK